MALAVRRYRVEGEVQGSASGEAAALDILERQLHFGPGRTSVTSVVRRELTSFDAVGLPSTFMIER